MKTFLELFCSRWRWGRRLLGGRWELWWCDPATAWVWIKVEEWTHGGKRPAGCAIWEDHPRPLAREDYTKTTL
jgi:hypothetical protein